MRLVCNTVSLLLISGVALSGQQPAVILGAGSSFIYPLMSRWAIAYNKYVKQEINYQSIGSGGGLTQLKQNDIAFAAVDMPQTVTTLKKQQWLQFPIAMGGIVITLNIPGIGNNKLRLSGKLIANIFLGKIKYWNAPAIKRLNPNVKLPRLAIVVIHRADGSGTTYNYTHYLSQVSTIWRNKIGCNTSVSWPAGVGGKGNSGVAMLTQRIPGSISYLEYSFAKLTKLKTAKLENLDGNFVSPGPDSFNAAAINAKWNSKNDFKLLLTNQPGKKSWPILATSFALVPKNIQINKITDFFNWAFKLGQKDARSLDYVPLPWEAVITVNNYLSRSLVNKDSKR